jgi:FtsP/CotA-like multicopper oxidase with cupredoxin domain
MQTRLGLLMTATVLTAIAVPRATFPHRAVLHADANDQRTPAGRMVDGELRVELDVVDLTWSPHGPHGPLVPAFGFAERGHAPQLPGPLLRVHAGTPVRVSVRNTLARAVRVRGLSDRVPGDTAVNFAPGFARQPALRLAPGEEREVRFTPTSAVTSFYFARLLPNGTDTLPEDRLNLPGAGSTQGGLVGAFIVDPAETAPPKNERIFVITSYASPLEPGNVTWRLSLNGLSWPYTERLIYDQDDTVHWRVINVSGVYHPMHLHGFYFAVGSRGDGQADTIVNVPRPLEVTEGMREISTMQLSWVADRAGNWLFHCHLIRHSSDTQKYSAERHAVASTSDMSSDMSSDHGMGGLILGITIHPRAAVAMTPPANARQLDLWTGTRPDVFGDSAGYGFVLQRGNRPPAHDSIVVPGSPLILERGEPTRIVVHNRLPFPLGVHWHGLELESYYDGVGNWSGQPGKTRGMIPAGDTMSVYITPPRSGTFMYHTHGELGARLAQGLYGTLIVLDRGHELNTDSDRLFVLASRGATLDADAAINGGGLQPGQRFSVGKTYRLRFTHISLDDVKHVRLLLDGKPVMWRPLAKDGATLPAPNRVETEAKQRMDVGETYDFEWTPAAGGVYVLEVGTDYYPARGTTALQRIAFGVGPVTEAALRVAATGTSLAVGDPLSTELPKLAGAFVSSTTAPSPDVVSVWSDSTGLAVSQTIAGVESPAHCLIPLADGSFVPGTCENGFMKEMVPVEHFRFDASGVVMGTGASARSFQRVAALKVSETGLTRFVGRYEFGFATEIRGGVLTLTNSGRPGERPGRDLAVGTPMSALSPSRFVGTDGPFAGVWEFTFKDGKVAALTLIGPNSGFTAKREP